VLQTTPILFTLGDVIQWAMLAEPRLYVGLRGTDLFRDFSRIM